MKALKKILILTLVLVLALSSFACNKRSEADSQGNSAESSIPEPPKVPQKLERADATTIVTDNLMLVTPRDLVGIAEEEVNPLEVIFGDLMIGDVAKMLLSEVLYFDYYDDGQWRLSNGTAFGAVPNAIFSYQIGSGKPLALDDTQLALYGNNTVLSCFSELFATNLENLPLGEGDLAQIIGDLSKITVQDLYDLTCGDITFFVDYLREGEVDLFAGALCEILSQVAGVQIDSTMLKQALSGTLAAPEIDVEYILLTAIPELIAEVQDEQANAILTFVCETVIEWLSESESEPVVEDLLAKLYQKLYEAEIQPILAEYGEMTLEQIDAELTDGMLITILPESVVAYFDNFQATLNDFIAEIEALIAGENQELMAVVSEIDALYSLQALANQGVIPQEVYALIDALIDGPFSNPRFNIELLVSRLLELVMDVVDAYVEQNGSDIYLSPIYGMVEEIAVLYHDVIIGDFIDATLSLHIDDVIYALECMTDQIIAHALIRETYILLRGVFTGTVGELGIDANARAELLIDYMYELANSTGYGYANEATFNQMYSEYGDMTITEFIAAFYEANADVPFSEIFVSFFTLEYV